MINISRPPTQKKAKLRDFFHHYCSDRKKRRFTGEETTADRSEWFSTGHIVNVGRLAYDSKLHIENGTLRSKRLSRYIFS